MKLIGLPKELYGAKWTRNDATGERELSEDATPEQKRIYKAFVEYCKSSSRRCTFEKGNILVS